MIIISGLGPADKGREVIYTDMSGKRESGRISSWNDKYVFVRFTAGDTAAACRPDDLHFAVEPDRDLPGNDGDDAWFHDADMGAR